MDFELWADSPFGKRDRNTAQRRAMAEAGTAMPDGSFPIANVTDLHNAIHTIGLASHPEAAKQHIITRARALGAVDQLPESWNVSKADSSILPAQPSSTTNSLYPGVGQKYPTQGGASNAPKGNIKSKYGKKPGINRGRSSDAQDSSGSLSSGGSGGSMGAKADGGVEGIWDGTAFSNMGCTPGSYKCQDIMCKVCMTKNTNF